jgi:hypothetical protein
VHHAGEHFLAGAGLAGDQDRHVGGRDAANGGKQPLHLLGEEESAGLLLGRARRPQRGAASLLLPGPFHRQRRASDAQHVGE